MQQYELLEERIAKKNRSNEELADHVEALKAQNEMLRKTVQRKEARLLELESRDETNGLQWVPVSEKQDRKFCDGF